MINQQLFTSFRSLCVCATLAASAVLAGCSSTSLNRAPVEDRNAAATAGATPASTVASGGAATPTLPFKPLPGAENAGKPGYYSVRPGDTIIRIGLETGQNWRDVARWNNLDNPNIIEVGQVLRVIAPGATAEVTTPGAFIPRPVAAPTAVTGTSIPPAGTTRTASAPVPAAPAPAPVAAAPVVASTPVAPASSAGEDDVAWIWPAPGSVIAGFDEAKNKGLDLNGKLGDPVLAAGDGRVVYAGAGLRGYGNLVILKHNNTYLTAYAHNQTLLVKEDQTVRKGQKIAEMGQSDADRVKLHFEIRRQGKPVDPARYLPAR
jgi:lipoprotein NlpD